MALTFGIFLLSASSGVFYKCRITPREEKKAGYFFWATWLLLLGILMCVNQYFDVI